MSQSLYSGAVSGANFTAGYFRENFEYLNTGVDRKDWDADDDEYPEDAKVVIEVVNEQQVQDKFDRSKLPEAAPGDAVPIACSDPEEDSYPDATVYVNTYRPNFVTGYALGTTLGSALGVPYGNGDGIMNYKYQVYPDWASTILSDWGSVKNRLDRGFQAGVLAHAKLQCGDFDEALTNVEVSRDAVDGLREDIETFVDRLEDRNVKFAPQALRDTITFFEEDHPLVLGHIEQQANIEHSTYATNDAPHHSGLRRKLQEDIRPTVSMEIGMYQTWVGDDLPLENATRDIDPEDIDYAGYGGDDCDQLPETPFRSFV